MLLFAAFSGRLLEGAREPEYQTRLPLEHVTVTVACRACCRYHVRLSQSSVTQAVAFHARKEEHASLVPCSTRYTRRLSHILLVKEVSCRRRCRLSNTAPATHSNIACHANPSLLKCMSLASQVVSSFVELVVASNPARRFLTSVTIVTLLSRHLTLMDRRQVTVHCLYF